LGSCESYLVGRCWRKRCFVIRQRKH
jgi:hypothetical protein